MGTEGPVLNDEPGPAPMFADRPGRGAPGPRMTPERRARRAHRP